MKFSASSVRIALNTALAVLVAVVSQAHCQKTWIVDAGGGGHYKTIQAAVNAASEGDTIYLKSAPFRESFTVSKGLHFRAAANNGISGFATITNLSKTSTLTIKGMSTASLRFTNNAGAIHCEDLTFSTASMPTVPPCKVSNCALISFQRCSRVVPQYALPVYGTQPPSIDISNSQVLLAECRIQGANDIYQTTISLAGSPGIAAVSSTVRISGGSVTGGNGTTKSPVPGITNAWPGIQISGGSLVIDDSEGKTFVAAGSTPSSTLVQHAIVDSGAKITIDPGVKLYSSNTSVHFKSTSPIVRILPGIVASGAVSGGKVTTSRFGTPGSLSVLLLSLPRMLLQTPFGEMWMDTSAILAIDPRILPASGSTTLHIPIPAQGIPNGVSLCFQSLELLKAQMTLSLPSVVLVN